MSGVQATTTGREAARTTAAVSVMDRFGHNLQRLPLHLVIIIFVAIWIIPTFGLIVNSFRSVSDMSNGGWWTALFPPHGFSFASYIQVLQTENVASSIVNSILITVPATVIQLAIATMGAYAFAWMKFPGKNLFFIVIVGLMVVPIQMTPESSWASPFTELPARLSGSSASCMSASPTPRSSRRCPTSRARPWSKTP